MRSDKASSSSSNLKLRRRRWKEELLYYFVLHTLIFSSCCAQFGFVVHGEVHSGADTEQDIEGDWYPGLFKRLLSPPSIVSTDARIPIAVTSHSWFGLVHGLPMMFMRPSAELSIELRTTFKDWLLTDRAPVWRELPENPHWSGPDKTSLTSKYSRYNVLQDALQASPEILAIGRRLQHFLSESLVEFITLYPDAIEAMHHEADRDAWQSRLGRVDRTAGNHRFGPFPIGVEVQSWMNAHERTTTADGGHEHTQAIHIHTHSASWHAFMPLDAAGTNTTFVAPPYHRQGGAGDGHGHNASVAFNIENSDGVLVMICGGVRHGVPPAATGGYGKEMRERVSVAFDFIYSATINGDTKVTHPGASLEMLDPVWPSSPIRKKVLEKPRLLYGPENVNTVLMTPVQLEKEITRALRRRGGDLGEVMEPLASDAQSVRDTYQHKHLQSLDFAGVLDMKELVGDAPRIYRDEL
eukprot:CAMPEP_0194229686 /NCGR_PEP_ID=MMETSP0156-20130528/44021_1 /TAXON_ID=33649 /ORGANISM="Thalassionema nitzschioides, Strain L26-B" /LENGTH=466 /DNA_ID=CAMNT_0038962245 /DNA_START=44 /DNA_END=1444 /DNA_ORIENTATION=-